MSGPLLPPMRTATRWAYTAILVYVAACASGSAAPNSLAEPQTDAHPGMISRNVPPQLVVPILASGRPSVRLQIQVMIDAAGAPDMSTLKVTGFGAGENTQAIANWIQGSSFRAGRKAGVPVAALYTTTLSAQARVVRQ